MYYLLNFSHIRKKETKKEKSILHKYQILVWIRVLYIPQICTSFVSRILIKNKCLYCLFIYSHSVHIFCKNKYRIKVLWPTFTCFKIPFWNFWKCLYPIIYSVVFYIWISVKPRTFFWEMSTCKCLFQNKILEILFWGDYMFYNLLLEYNNKKKDKKEPHVRYWFNAFANCSVNRHNVSNEYILER